MCNELDRLELAHKLAEIARTTRDAATGTRLLELVNRLLADAGLPDDDDIGGGEPPTHWMSEPDCAPA
ncbi:MAG TPA: hypothetical protein VGG99_20285 [Acetobacteraceae bacterium]|jgi:hypothetical protein